MAFGAAFSGFGPLVYILLGSRYLCASREFDDAHRRRKHTLQL